MRFALILALLCTRVPALAAQDPLRGFWRGYWMRAGDTLAVSMTVQLDPATGRYRAAFSSDRLRVSGIPFADVQVKGCCEVTMTLRGDRTTTVFTGRLLGDSLSGVLREGTSEGRFAYSRASASASLSERDITFRSGDVTLAGSLLLPSSGNSFAALVFLHGSGPEGRWASRYLAEQVVARGIAALIYDKRGVGGSTGDWRTATPEDLMRDGMAAVARLVEEPGIDRRRVGIHGHSQGGTLAPMLAAQSPHVRFVIASAAAGIPTDSTELFSVLNSVRPATRSPQDSADANAYVSELVAVAYRGRPRTRLDSLVSALRGRPWFFAPPAPDNSYWSFSKAFALYDPLAWWARVHVPVLLIYGADDQRVPARESAARIAATLLRAGNGDVTIRILPGADHTFRLLPSPSGWPVTAPDYVPSLLDWLARRR
jgi:pimeloyl-ACP methyl ester carboxylesterase